MKRNQRSEIKVKVLVVGSLSISRPFGHCVRTANTCNDFILNICGFIKQQAEERVCLRISFHVMKNMISMVRLTVLPDGYMDFVGDVLSVLFLILSSKSSVTASKDPSLIGLCSLL